MLTAVFMDIDNTILDFNAYVKQSMEEGFRRFGLPEYRPEMFDVFEKVNAVLWKRIEDGLLTLDGLREVRWNLVFERLNIPFDGPVFEECFKACLFESAIPVEGAMDLLHSLRGKAALFAASNGPGAQQRNRLSAAGMAACFDGIYVSEEIGVSKPDPAFFLRCLDKAGEKLGRKLWPEECLMVGDSLRSDIQGAAAVGMRTCLYCYGGRVPDNPACKAADAAVTRLDQIPALLESRF